MLQLLFDQGRNLDLAEDRKNIETVNLLEMEDRSGIGDCRLDWLQRLRLLSRCLATGVRGGSQSRLSKAPRDVSLEAGTLVVDLLKGFWPQGLQDLIAAHAFRKIGFDQGFAIEGFNAGADGLGEESRLVLTALANYKAEFLSDRRGLQESPPVPRDTRDS